MHRFFYNIISILFLLLSFSDAAVCQTKKTGKNIISEFSIDEMSEDLEVIDLRIELSRHKGDLKKLAKAYELKGDYLHEQKLGISVIYYEKALDLYTKVYEKEGELRLLKFLSTEYIKISDRQNALKKMYTLLDIYQATDDTLRIAQTYSGIGSLYADLNENSEALEYMQKALDLSILLNQKNGEAAIRNNIAGVYKSLNLIERAFQNVRIAERLNLKSGNAYWLSINHTMYADLYSELNKMDSVRYYLFKSFEYTSKEGRINDSIDLFRKTGIYYFKVDSIQKALNMFNQGILASRKLGSLKSEAIFTHWISEVYEVNGEMELALSFLQIRHDLLDSLAKKQSGKRIEEYKVLYEVKSLESDLSNSKMRVYLARNEAIQSRNRMCWVLAILFMVILGSIVIAYQFRKQVRTNRHLLELNVRTSNIETPSTDKYAQSNLSDGKKEEILNLLVNLMVSEQIYTDQEIKLDTVAKKLDVSRTYLSQVINETYSQNFTTYINSYRINLAKTFLLSDEHDKYSIQGIAEIVGFKSVSAFNTSFKKTTGLAPSYYRRNGKKVK
jgi:AraC-like DNA-binding protein